MSEFGRSSDESRLADFLVDTLEDRIRGRAQAERLALLDELFPEYRPQPEERQPGHERGNYQLEELLGGSDTTFVKTAYREVLGREPDMTGMETRLQAMEGGTSRVVILGSIRYSPEGKERGVRIKGLSPAYLIGRLRTLPAVGSVVGLLTNVRLLPDYRRRTVELQNLVHEEAAMVHALHHRLAAHIGDHPAAPVAVDGPSTVPGIPDDQPLSLSTVLGLERDQLVTLAYSRCAGRPPSAEEAATAGQQLATGSLSPVRFLGQLCDTFGKEPAELHIVALPEALRREAWRHYPVIGVLVRIKDTLALFASLDTVLDAHRRETSQLLENCEARLAEHYNTTLIELKRLVIERVDDTDGPSADRGGR